jgi:hydroxyacylglutathione hydrolase
MGKPMRSMIFAQTLPTSSPTISTRRDSLLRGRGRSAGQRELGKEGRNCGKVCSEGHLDQAKWQMADYIRRRSRAATCAKWLAPGWLWTAGKSSCALLALGMLITASPARSQPVPGSIDVHWNEGANDCKASPQAPIEVHDYNATTFMLRENLCATFEAPFMYLLIGSTKALLIDTGDVADPNQMPLAKTVMNLLSRDRPAKLPLLVVHTHRHLDHRAGDGQFTHLPNVKVVGFDIDSVRRFYHFDDWPNGLAQVDLGDRAVDVIPTPGHNETEVSFYDLNTGLFFSGDYLMPARLLIDDSGADLASAKRVSTFVRDRPVSFVLGGHIELDAAGETFPWQSRYHPHEHVLQMTKADLLALPAVISSFNGFYKRNGSFVLMNSMRVFIAEALAAGIVLIALVLTLVLYVRRRKRTRKPQVADQGQL